jgi:hypothetical protein
MIPSGGTPLDANATPGGAVPARVVAAGVDSLYLGYVGTASRKTLRDFERAQSAARRQKKMPRDPVTGAPLDLVEDEILELGEQVFSVRSYGASNATFLGTHEDMQIAVEPEGAPTLQVRPTARLLWRVGLDRAIAIADSVARAVLRETDDRYVQRIDVCADYQGEAPTVHTLERVAARGQISRRAFATGRAPGEGERTEVIGEGLDPNENAMLRELFMRQRVTGFRFGNGGPVVLRWYDKTEEIRVSRKFWFEDMYARHPDYVVGEHVWRVEAQVKREYLRNGRDEHGLRLESVEDVALCAPAIYRDVLDRIRLHVFDDERGDRCTTDPLWETLATTAEFDGHASGNGRVTSREQVRSDKTPLLAAARGYMASIGAVNGAVNWEDGALEALAEIKEMSEAQGVDVNALVRKAREKRRKSDEREALADARARDWSRRLVRACPMFRRARRVRPPQVQLQFTWPARVAQTAFPWSTT